MLHEKNLKIAGVYEYDAFDATIIVVEDADPDIGVEDGWAAFMATAHTGGFRYIHGAPKLRDDGSVNVTYEEFLGHVDSMVPSFATDFEEESDDDEERLWIESRAISFEEALEFMDCSESYLYRLIREGRIRTVSVEEGNKIDRDSVFGFYAKSTCSKKTGELAFKCRKHGTSWDTPFETCERCKEEMMSILAKRREPEGAELDRGVAPDTLFECRCTIHDLRFVESAWLLAEGFGCPKCMEELSGIVAEADVFPDGSVLQNEVYEGNMRELLELFKEKCIVFEDEIERSEKFFLIKSLDGSMSTFTRTAEELRAEWLASEEDSGEE